MARILVMLVLLLVQAGPAARAQPVVLGPGLDVLALAGRVAASPRGSAPMQPHEALAAWREGRFEALPGNLARGWRKEEVWLAFELRRQGLAADEVVLEVGPAYLDEVAVWVAAEGAAPVFAGRAGDQVPRSEVALAAARPAIALRLPPDGHTAAVLVRIRTISSQAAVMKLYRTGSFNGAVARNSLVMGAMFAFTGISLLIAGAFFILTRRVIYMGMIAYVALTAVLFAFYDGLAYLYIDWADLADINRLTSVLGTASLAVAAMFVTAAFDFRDISRGLDRAFRAYAGVIFAAALSSLLLPWQILGSVVNLAAFPLILGVGFGLAVQMARRHADALLYGPVYLVYTGFAAYNTVTILGWADMDDVSLYGWQVAGVLGFVCLQVLMYRRAWQQEKGHRAKRRQLVAMLRERNRGLEQRVAERTRELAGALQEVQQAVAAQREMLSVASHEFRTPAAMIKASVDSLGYLHEQIPAPVAQRLDNIGQASARLQRLANNLLSFQRLQELALKPQRERFDLGRRLVTLVAGYPGEARPALAAVGSCEVVADPVLVDIALNNLIDNANRYNDAAAGPVQVSVAAQGGQAVVTVADNGPGIAPEDRERVFERYVSSRPGPANGLGLAIVRSIARAHGGDARAGDNRPCGACLTLVLPLAG